MPAKENKLYLVNFSTIFFLCSLVFKITVNFHNWERLFADKGN